MVNGLIWSKLMIANGIQKEEISKELEKYGYNRREFYILDVYAVNHAK